MKDYNKVFSINVLGGITSSTMNMLMMGIGDATESIAFCLLYINGKRNHFTLCNRLEEEKLIRFLLPVNYANKLQKRKVGRK